MHAAFTLVVLFAFSTLIVRAASTILRHTGLPDNIARLQSISALSGTGFTTPESELLTADPIRRKVLMFLMIFGNLGMASVATTFIVALINTNGDTGDIFIQVIAFVVAIVATLVVMTNPYLDKKFCDIVSYFLSKSSTFKALGYKRIAQISLGYSIAEHVVNDNKPMSDVKLELEEFGLCLLGCHIGERRVYQTFEQTDFLKALDVVVVYGSEQAHKAFNDDQLMK